MPVFGNGCYDGSMVRGKVVVGLDVGICGRDAISDEEVQEIR